jgi:hypothetical protein
MKALVLDNVVIDVAEVAFAVHEALTWVDCPIETEAGFTVEDGVFIAPPDTHITPTYAELRQGVYPSLTEQADMAYWDRQNNTTTLDDAISAVKAEFPKPV